MLKTVTTDIINDKALNLLMDLERLQLIRLRRKDFKPSIKEVETRNYKGIMSKQPIDEVDGQLDLLRNGWE